MEHSRPGKSSQLRQRYDKRVKNTSGSTIPPFGIMRITGATKYGEDEFYNVAQPSGSGSEKYLLNGPQEIVSGGEGSATDDYPAVARYDGTGGTPIPTELWGPFGSFSLSVNGTGFLIVGTPENGLVRVAEAGPLATAGADFPIIIVRNMSGTARGNRSIFSLSTPISVPPDQLPIQPYINSAAPDAGKFWVVSLSNVNHLDYVDCAPVGVLAVQIDYRGQEYSNDALRHDFVDAQEGNYSVLKSSQDGPGRILWRAKQGVSGSATQGVQWAIINLDHQGILSSPRILITTEVTAATGTRGNPLTPGKGKGQLYTPPYTGIAGSIWLPSGVVDVETIAFETTPVGKMCACRASRRLPTGHIVYEIIAEPCKEMPEETP
jgi:hypothetical protein